MKKSELIDVLASCKKAGATKEQIQAVAIILIPKASDVGGLKRVGTLAEFLCKEVGSVSNG